jgi:hypothetical protein
MALFVENIYVEVIGQYFCARLSIYGGVCVAGFTVSCTAIRENALQALLAWHFFCQVLSLGCESWERHIFM